jgi:penicillin-binding protein 2
MEIAGQDAELPEIRHRTRVFAALVLLVFCGLAGRLFYLQALRGESYHRLTSESLVRTVPLPALRGELRDRRGRVLATTRASYDVLVTPSQLERAAYDRLVRLLGPERDDLPSWERLREAARKAAKSGRELAVTFAPDISRDQMALIETTLESPGLRVVGAARREYPHGTLLAHTLGYLNEISAEELRERKDEGYAPGDQIGRTGLERQWESHLRGRNGFERAFARRNMVMSGEVKVSDVVDGPVRQEPVAGSHVVLSIDLDAQKILDRAIRSKPAAAAVLVDVETGRVLAIGSRPTFDPNVMSGRLTAEEQARILMDRNRPFLDKTLSETFNPGSTFKAISATAALEERLLTIDDRVRCGGFVRIGQRRFRCQKTHGSIGLHAAIIQSCNVFFYELGLRPGMMNRLAKFALDFGLGAPTGAGINGEQPGFVPTEEWHRAQKLRDPRNEGFVVGHALNTAIGEGATRVTVMQMALVYAAIANGGRLWLPQLVERVEGPGGEVVVPAARPARPGPVPRDPRDAAPGAPGRDDRSARHRLQGPLPALRHRRQDGHRAGVAGQPPARGRARGPARPRLVRGLRAGERSEGRLRSARRARRSRRRRRCPGRDGDGRRVPRSTAEPDGRRAPAAARSALTHETPPPCRRSSPSPSSASVSTGRSRSPWPRSSRSACSTSGPA